MTREPLMQNITLFGGDMNLRDSEVKRLQNLDSFVVNNILNSDMELVIILNGQFNSQSSDMKLVIAILILII